MGSKANYLIFINGSVFRLLFYNETTLGGNFSPKLQNGQPLRFSMEEYMRSVTGSDNLGVSK